MGEMAKTVKESSKCIDEYKKMNVELMKQNKTLHNRLNDVVSKYKQLTSYNDQLDHKNLKSVKRMDTLSELCRKLQLKNKDLSEDLKMAKSSLFNQGISLEFKSDKKENSKQKDKENEQSENKIEKTETETEQDVNKDENEEQNGDAEVAVEIDKEQTTKIEETTANTEQAATF